MNYMTNEFESMLNVIWRAFKISYSLQETLTKMTKKLEFANQRWKENDNLLLSEANAKRLEDFNLTRIALGKLEN